MSVIHLHRKYLLVLVLFTEIRIKFFFLTAHIMSEYFEFQINKRYAESPSNYLEKKHNFNKHREKDRCQALRDLKDNIGASLNQALSDKSCFDDDNFLYRFLYARKFQSDEALKLLENYLSYKKRNQLLLRNLNIFDEKIQLSLRDGIPTVLKQRDRKGRKVILFLASNWDPIKYSLEDIFRAILLSLDVLLDNVQNQALGFVIIVDWTNFPFQKSRQISPKLLKLMIEGLQVRSIYSYTTICLSCLGRGKGNSLILKQLD